MRNDHYDSLATKEPVLARLVGVHGRPDPFAWNDGGRTGSDNFSAMVLHIVSQQISTAAFTIFGRITTATGGLPDQDGLLRLGVPRRHRRLRRRDRRHRLPHRFHLRQCHGHLRHWGAQRRRQRPRGR